MRLVVPPDSPFKTLKELVDFGRANPGKIRHGSVGYGGDSHVAFKTLELGAGFTATVVPYDSGADVAANIAGGHIDAAASSAGSIMPLVRGGQARILAVLSSKERIAALPDIPTAWEQGIEIIAPNWRGWLAPPNVPAERVQYIADVFERALAEDRDLVARIENEAEIPTFMGPKEFKAYLAEVDVFLGGAIKAIQEEEKRLQK
jgi:tripartite-type tricarboxylate transporter receptor subunit TctC